MLKIEHISKTFNPGTVNEKQAIRDLSLNLNKAILQQLSVPMELVNPLCLMQSVEIFLQIPV